ncbi:hypothetical protein [Achromobacter aloeverae]|uniref:Uncharacterized protein n=1 Tax=Achromobacter aloeverae TaxID=1750518 RepID=A0A4V1MS23_9BURK|nr:hypothetical protein [Achromobacter aloeverae]RXN87980.1 hypothetical protein C7R54_15495 [Achromobacter aloeverae]
MKDLATLAILAASLWLPDPLREAQAAWERAHHCQVTGHTDPGVYQTYPRRAVMKCDGGVYVRPTE